MCTDMVLFYYKGVLPVSVLARVKDLFIPACRAEEIKSDADSLSVLEITKVC